MLVDTDVLIWVLKRNETALALLAGLEGFFVSDVTHMELIQGARNKAEQSAIDQSLRSAGIVRLSLNESISRRAVSIVQQYSLSHSVQMADALIAATALEYDLPVVTGNVKHFSVIDGLAVQTFKPGVVKSNRSEGRTSGVFSRSTKMG